MSPTPRNLRNRKRLSNSNKWTDLASKGLQTLTNPSELIDLIKNLLFNPNKLTFVALCLIPIELFLNILIVYKIPCKLI